MTYHNYISFYLIFISVFYLILKIESFVPEGRFSHSSILVENKLYFFGGILRNVFFSNEVFYLDVSRPFNIASSPWNDLTANQGMPIKNCAGAVSLSVSNNEQRIYLFGGLTQDLNIGYNDSAKPFVYRFNPKSGQWEIPIIKGKVPEKRIEMKSIISVNSGKIYIFGGRSEQSYNCFNDMVVFGIGELSWSISYPFNAPTPRTAYSATLLSNGVIVYIGGYQAVGTTFQIVDISQINLYDTNTLTWSTNTAKLIVQIEGRLGHTALLAPNGEIIIYGGGVLVNNVQATPDTAVLNIETLEWRAPIVSSNIGKVPSLTYHTANLVGNYMIVAFGNITQQNSAPLALQNANIYIMDVRNYTWVNTFEPENIVKPTPSSNPKSTTSINPTNTSDVSDQLTTMKVIIGVLSAIFGTVLVMIIGIFGYKWYQRKKQNNIMRIHVKENKT